MILKNLLLCVPLLAASVIPASAQWTKVPLRGLPMKNGQVDMTGPAPHTADGRPDLSGVWQGETRFLQNLAVDLKPGELMMLPWAEALTNERKTGKHAAEEPQANCLPPGIPRINSTPYAFKIIETSDEVLILYESYELTRQIFLDGRQIIKDTNPSWMGYSVGKWEKDALVVDTTGFNGKTWLDAFGHPTTDALHIVERYRRRDAGHLEIQVTIDDPKAYAKPWNVTQVAELQPGSEVLEFACDENNTDLPHLPGGKK
jgi:hypothetical protein